MLPIFTINRLSAIMPLLLKFRNCLHFAVGVQIVCIFTVYTHIILFTPVYFNLSRSLVRVVIRSLVCEIQGIIMGYLSSKIWSMIDAHICLHYILHSLNHMSGVFYHIFRLLLNYFHLWFCTFEMSVSREFATVGRPHMSMKDYSCSSACWRLFQ